MNLIISGIVAGVIGTMFMDLMNNLVARTGLLLKIDMALLGRMTAGWTHGRFIYNHPDELEPVPNEKIYGYLTHFAIGISLAVPFITLWGLFVKNPLTPFGAIIFGISTTAASFFLVYPSMGLGVCGLKSPVKIKAFVSPLANHFFYGVGLAIAVAIL